MLNRKDVPWFVAEALEGGRHEETSADDLYAGEVDHDLSRDELQAIRMWRDHYHQDILSIPTKKDCLVKAENGEHLRTTYCVGNRAFNRIMQDWIFLLDPFQTYR